MKKVKHTDKKRTPRARRLPPSKHKNKRPDDRKTYTGVFESSRDGYGFITADEEFRERFGADLFVPAKHVKDAVTGDSVRFTVDVHNGRTEAHIEKITARKTKTFTGVYRYIKRREGGKITVRHAVFADDRKLCFDTLIPASQLCGAVDGDKVLCEITSYPDTTNQIPARGVILKTYGSADLLYPNVEAALDRAEVRTGFPDEVTEYADAAASVRVLKKGRLDLTGERIFTIDGADSKDMDDAISVKRTEDGFELGVHIADVSEYVKHGSAADREAYLRGTSIYFADRVIPMLPQSLSNGACSLNPRVNRYALSAIISVDAEGEIKDCRVEETVIRSAVRGVYTEVNDVIENKEKSVYYKKYAPVLDQGGLDDLLALYDALARKSKRRHALELESTELHFVIGEDGKINDMFPEERGVAERMIEQFMLAANEAVASLLLKRGLPCVYRVHGTPDPEKLRQLKAFAESVGIDGSALSGEDVTLCSVEKFLDAAREKGKGEIFSYMILRCMMKAKYSPQNSPHYGLGAKCYCHFTSPIRRYPDLVVHRIIKTLLLHKDAEADKKLRAYSVSAAERSNDCEDTATKLEREMDDLYAAAYMKDRIGERYDATVTAVTNAGFYAALPNGAEGFVRLPAVNVEFIPSLYTIVTPTKTYRPGDAVKVAVSDVSINDRRIELVTV
ncbi:MAG: VacB/RNase II family 3'-5' exoribonuclease [Clostridia bacterium]|nr:VacB/RNase II family 3'-5' exoribonuclease [Clostridia bacterium]